tara:strand:+ start:535 stop:915 length:381 start_codon:yes stop_codon:yes gene_type:complete
MPVYAYRCPSCGNAFDRVLALKDYKEPQKCPSCDSLAIKAITPVGFVLKGDGWAGKNLKIKSQMSKKNQRLDSKMNEMKKDQPVATLAPNVGGERVGSWTEAKKLAASKGKNTATYDKYVAKEKSG